MRYILILTFLSLLVGCGRGPQRRNQTSESLSTNLTLRTYELRNPMGDSDTTVYELCRMDGDYSFIVSMIYGDSHGRLITLAGTPVTSDNISCDSGIFQIGLIPDVPIPELHLFLDRRGNVSSKTVESHYTREASALRTRGTEAVLVVNSRPIDDRHIECLMEVATPRILTITTEQGAPVKRLLETIKLFAHQADDIRLAMLPWDWANPPGVIDETEGAPTTQSTLSPEGAPSDER